jgi:hypothetical protein
MGLEPGTTRAQVRRCLEDWDKGDNGILDLSAAYRLKRGTGWLIPPGVLHAPGSLCTYEPQWGSDVFGMFQSLVEGRAVPWELLVKDVPPEHHHDLDFIIGMLDWDANVDPHYAEHRLFHPKPVSTAQDGYSEKWVVYSTDYYSAKELTIAPRQSVLIRDAAAYGLIVVQGWGSLGKLELETPSLIRLGQMTKDELFVSAAAATRGVKVTNRSDTEDLVMLKHFGPGNPDAAGLRK